MYHTFLLEPGRWNLKGHQLSAAGDPVPVTGQSLVRWDSADWFHALLRFTYSKAPDREPLVLEYRGRIPEGAHSYTFVLQHSELGRVEGEGWITPAALVHRYWVLGDPKKRTGYESFFRASDTLYCFSSGIISGLRLAGGLEALMEQG